VNAFCRRAWVFEGAILVSLLAWHTDSLSAMIEGRAVWISLWEWTGSHNPSGDQSKIRQVLRALHWGRFNMAFFQVRGEADALYPSPYEPWDKELTGEFGKDPGWDPLEYAIEEAHSLGIELHAWVNVFTMWRGTSPPLHTKPEHIYYLHYPEWACHDSKGKPMALNKSYIFVSPGNLEAREHVLRVCLDIVSRYKVDGIHFDYIRYPDADYSHDPVSLARFKNPAENPNQLTWADWQREQVSAFVREFSRRAMEIRNDLKISAAVIGKYNAPSTGWDGYNTVYQDAKAWAREGTVDIICPMIYWPIGPNSPAPFERYLRQWVVEDPLQGLVMVGIGAYKYKGNLLETIAQIGQCRKIGANGQVMFSYEGLDDPGYWDDLVVASYTSDARVPQNPWKTRDSYRQPGQL
jgi:uncharacterized lipoprotein YddW (UPF0748 family)